MNKPKSPYRQTVLQEAISALENAKTEGGLPEDVQQRIDALGSTRSKARRALSRMISTPIAWLHRGMEAVTNTRTQVAQDIPLSLPASPLTSLTPSPVAPSSTNVQKAPAVIIQPPKDPNKMTVHLDELYDLAAETQKVFGLNYGERTPDFTQVRKIFTPKMMIAASFFQDPSLIFLTKGRSFIDMGRALDFFRTVQDRGETTFNPLMTEHGAQILEHWSAYIVEGELEMKDLLTVKMVPQWNLDEKRVEVAPTNSLELPIRKRMSLFSEGNHTCVTGMDRWKYMQLAMQKLQAGLLIDADHSTILDADPIVSKYSGRTVPIAAWIKWKKQYRFNCDSSDGVLRFGRFRRSVGGPIRG
jgi:hypothetical protein